MMTYKICEFNVRSALPKDAYIKVNTPTVFEVYWTTKIAHWHLKISNLENDFEYIITINGNGNIVVKLSIRNKQNQIPANIIKILEALGAIEALPSIDS